VFTAQYELHLCAQFRLMVVFKWFKKVMWWQDWKCNTPSSTDIGHHAVCYQKTNIPLTFAQVRNNVQRLDRKPYEHRLANICYQNIKYPAQFLVTVLESSVFLTVKLQNSILLCCFTKCLLQITCIIRHTVLVCGAMLVVEVYQTLSGTWCFHLYESSFHWNVSKFLPNYMASHCTS
jgi:hypothetical protein